MRHCVFRVQQYQGAIMTSISPVKPGPGIDMSPASGASPRSASERPSRLPDPSTARLSLVGKFQSALSAFVDSAEKLGDGATWSGTRASSSDPASVVAVSHNADVAHHSVAIHNLASAQVSTSAPVADHTARLGINTLHIEIGAWGPSQATFTNNPNWPKSSIVVGPNDNSLERIRDKINAAGAGIVATVISDGTGSRLVLRATASGADLGFKITSDDPSQPDSGASDPALNALGLQNQLATDATGTVDGVPVRSSTNSVDAAAGLTLYFRQATDSPVEVTVAPDTEAIMSTVKGFAQAYNELHSMGQAPSPSQALRSSPLAQSLSESGVSFDTRGNMQVDTQKLGARLSEAALQPSSLGQLAGQFGQLVEHLTGLTRPAAQDAEVSRHTALLLAPYRVQENSGK